MYDKEQTTLSAKTKYFCRKIIKVIRNNKGVTFAQTILSIIVILVILIMFYNVTGNSSNNYNYYTTTNLILEQNRQAVISAVAPYILKDIPEGERIVIEDYNPLNNLTYKEEVEDSNGDNGVNGDKKDITILNFNIPIIRSLHLPETQIEFEDIYGEIKPYPNPIGDNFIYPEYSIDIVNKGWDYEMKYTYSEYGNMYSFQPYKTQVAISKEVISGIYLPTAYDNDEYTSYLRTGLLYPRVDFMDVVQRTNIRRMNLYEEGHNYVR